MLSTETPVNEQTTVQTAISEIGEIATLPEVTVKIIKVVEDPKSTARDLHEVIKNDPALSARILKVVNSAFYGLPGQIASVDRAIVLLGLSAVKNIAIAASMTRLFQGGTQIDGFEPMELWRHCIAVGVASRMITKAQGKPSVEESFLAGLIHDLGILVERQVFPRKLVDVIAKHSEGRQSFPDVERAITGADHQAFGMALATKWRFPRVLCIAIGYHHQPMSLTIENRQLPLLVHVADVIAARAEIGFTATARSESYDDAMIAELGVTPEALQEIADQLVEQVDNTAAMFGE